ncbi:MULTISPECIES: hypothetical protein [unclassified Arthrobacter]|uniref:hypothetical protein n=1 Tax=unclassified Arthrobacter TaxID=235627 RepID=UPI00211A63BC|nr:hypothetical protein [Arthrobacter sp. STN4]MCQ9165797.1 hypothetical protein [Arthrobacter sp. STN4]
MALALLFVVLMGLKVWRDGLKTLHAVNEVGEQLGTHWAECSEAAAQAQKGEARSTVPGAAVFATPEKMKDDYLAAKEARQFSRLQQRVARRKERGQLQSLRDIKALQDVG